MSGADVLLPQPAAPASPLPVDVTDQADRLLGLVGTDPNDPPTITEATAGELLTVARRILLLLCLVTETDPDDLDPADV